jgi:glutaredoxin
MKAISVLILTQQDCAFCDAAKTLMDRLSRKYPLSVATLPLDSTDGRALAEKGGILFPPGIFIDEEPFSYGRPSEGKLRREIERRLAAR